MYKPISSVNRVEDFEIPDFMPLGGEMVKVPHSMKRKHISYMLRPTGQVTRTAWIDKALGYIYNSQQLEGEYKTKELEKALAEVDKTIGSLIKNDLLKGRHRGAMSFSQACSTVPKDCIVISDRSYKKLCESSKIWENTSKVSVVRFPNLGPSTTKLLKLVVNREKEPSPTCLGNRVPALRDLLEETYEEEINLVDAFYLNPDVLKDDLTGDSDGYKFRV